MTGVLIVGYGNPLRGDDGLGWHAAQRLSEILPQTSAEIVTLHQLTPELAESVSQADLVILIDAGCDGQPGTFSCQAVQPREILPTSFTHDFDAAALLTLTNLLFGHCPPAYLLTITAEAFGYEERLSPSVEAALPGLIACVSNLIGHEQ